MGASNSCITLQDGVVASVCLGYVDDDLAQDFSTIPIEEYASCATAREDQPTSRWRVAGGEVHYQVSARPGQPSGGGCSPCCFEEPAVVPAEIRVDQEHAPSLEAGAESALPVQPLNLGQEMKQAVPALPMLLQAGRSAQARLAEDRKGCPKKTTDEEEHSPGGQALDSAKGGSTTCTSVMGSAGCSTCTSDDASARAAAGWPASISPSSHEACSRWRIFKVVIERDSPEESLGVDVAHIEDKLLQVINISTDSRTAAAEVFQLGDIILQVNGVKGHSDQMVHECALREDLVFRVARPDDEDASEQLLKELSRPPVPRLKLPQMKKPVRRRGA